MSKEQAKLPERAYYNAGIAADWNDTRWSSWFRAVCDERERRDADPLRLHPSVRLAEEVDDIYHLLLEKSRYAMRLGLGYAVAAWNPAHYSYGVLSRLTWIVAQIRAAEAVPPLLQILRDYRKTLLSGSDETIKAADDVISILGGFVPDPEITRIESVFIDLLHSNDVAKQLAGTLAVAVSTRKPELLAPSFNRFYALKDEAPHNYFRYSAVLRAFKKAVTREEFYREFAEMDPPAADFFISEGSHQDVITMNELQDLPFPKRSNVTQHAALRRRLLREKIEKKTGQKRPNTASIYSAGERLGEVAAA